MNCRNYGDRANKNRISSFKTRFYYRLASGENYLSVTSEHRLNGGAGALNIYKVDFKSFSIEIPRFLRSPTAQKKTTDRGVDDVDAIFSLQRSGIQNREQ